MTKKKEVEKKEAKLDATKEMVEIREIAGTKYYTMYGMTKAGGWGERHIHEEINRGNLKASKPGKELLFSFENVAKWIAKKVA